MATIDVSPEGLREAGSTLNDARETMVTESNAHMLHGVGDDRYISSGGFPPGALAQQLLANQYNRAQEVFNNIFNNFVAVSSGLYMVADLFESTDQEEALKFAFLEPGAEIPDGLPSYIDPEVTSRQMREKAEAQQALNGGDLPEGWTRRERHTSPYSTVTEIVDADGNVVGALNTSYFNGRRTEYYTDAKGQVVSTRVSVRDADGSYVIQSYNGTNTQRNLTREEHKDVGADGSTRYYTNRYEDGEQTDTTDRLDVDPESQAALPGEYLGRTLDEAEYQARAQQVHDQASNTAGNTEDTYEGPHNRVAH